MTARQGHRSLDTTNTKQLLPYSKPKRVPRAPYLHPHKTHTHSLRTGVRQRCAYIFLVSAYKLAGQILIKITASFPGPHPAYRYRKSRKGLG